MKEMCVTFLNFKKSNQKPSGDVYSLGWNLSKSKIEDFSRHFRI